MRKFLLASGRPEDIDLVLQTAKKMGTTCDIIGSWEQLLQALEAAPNAVVFWDADHSKNLVTDHPLSTYSIQRVLKPTTLSIALTGKTLNQYPEIVKEISRQGVHHENYIVRRFESALGVFPNVLTGFLAGETKGLAPFFPVDSRIQRINLANSSQRASAVNAVESYLSKLGINPKLSSKVAQCCDELLMNAIFNAPHSKDDVPFRKSIARSSKFEFLGGERVELETASTDDFVGICISDYYGTFSEGVMAKFLNQNYREEDYAVRKYGPGAGLGLYGIPQAGISLVVNCDERKRTDVSLFFQRTSSLKEFKRSFQFVLSSFRR